MEDVSELPRYRSHKVVQAAKIMGMQFNNPDIALEVVMVLVGGFRITPSREVWARISRMVPFPVGGDTEAWPGLIGGYYVKYEDGYESWSPSEAFEDGYTRV